MKAQSLLQNQDIICIAPGYWDESALDVHRYMRLLAQQNRVLVVERPVTPLSFIAPGQRRHALPQFQYWLTRQLRQPETNLWILTPAPVLPLRYEDIFLRLNQWLRYRSIRTACKTLNFQKPVLWNYDPDAAPLIGRFDEKVSLYCVTDDYASNPLSLNRAAQVQKWDQRLAAGVDLVICTEPALAEQKCPYNENTHYIPHGVEYELFARTRTPQQPITPELQQLSGTVIGFVGRVNRRIDMSIIHAIRDKHPDWTLLFVGSIGEDLTAAGLTQLPGVILTGQKPVDELSAYLKAMQVCIIPYVLNAHTRHMHPLKALEYLAAGRAVVSTPLPALQQHAPFIDFAATPDSFVQAIENALRQDSPAQQEARSRYTADKTWAARLEDISHLIDDTLREKTIF